MSVNCHADDDETLMQKIQQGNKNAFAVLVNRHTPKFYAVAYRHLLDQSRAEDLLQEIFLKVWQQPGKWDKNKGVRFTTWFYRVVVNACFDDNRKRQTWRHWMTNHLFSLTPAPHKTHEETLSAKQQVQQALQALPEKQRMAIILCFYEGLTNQEAANAMGIGLKALQSLLMRAKKTLKTQLLNGDPNE